MRPLFFFRFRLRVYSDALADHACQLRHQLRLVSHLDIHIDSLTLDKLSRAAGF